MFLLRLTAVECTSSMGSSSFPLLKFQRLLGESAHTKCHSAFEPPRGPKMCWPHMLKRKARDPKKALSVYDHFKFLQSLHSLFSLRSMLELHLAGQLRKRGDKATRHEHENPEGRRTGADTLCRPRQSKQYVVIVSPGLLVSFSGGATEQRRSRRLDCRRKFRCGLERPWATPAASAPATAAVTATEAASAAAAAVSSAAAATASDSFYQSAGPCCASPEDRALCRCKCPRFWEQQSIPLQFGNGRCHRGWRHGRTSWREQPSASTVPAESATTTATTAATPADVCPRAPFPGHSRRHAAFSFGLACSS